MKKIIALALLMAGVTAMEAGNRIIEENIIQTDKKNIEMEDLELTKEWDKIFPKSYKVNHSKVTFRNRYGITLAADMYTPKNINGKMAAIAISGPFGAVKEQASGLCTNNGRTRFPNHRFRSFIHWREWWNTPLCSLSRHQHRGLLRSCGFPLYTR